MVGLRQVTEPVRGHATNMQSWTQLYRSLATVRTGFMSLWAVGWAPRSGVGRLVPMTRLFLGGGGALGLAKARRLASVLRPSSTRAWHLVVMCSSGNHVCDLLCNVISSPFIDGH